MMDEIPQGWTLKQELAYVKLIANGVKSAITTDLIRKPLLGEHGDKPSPYHEKGHILDLEIATESLKSMPGPIPSRQYFANIADCLSSSENWRWILGDMKNRRPEKSNEGKYVNDYEIVQKVLSGKKEMFEGHALSKLEKQAELIVKLKDILPQAFVTAIAMTLNNAYSTDGTKIMDLRKLKFKKSSPSQTPPKSPTSTAGLKFTPDSLPKSSIKTSETNKSSSAKNLNSEFERDAKEEEDRARQEAVDRSSREAKADREKVKADREKAHRQRQRQQEQEQEAQRQQKQEQEQEAQRQRRRQQEQEQEAQRQQKQEQEAQRQRQRQQEQEAQRQRQRQQEQEAQRQRQRQQEQEQEAQRQRQRQQEQEAQRQRQRQQEQEAQRQRQRQQEQEAQRQRQRQQEQEAQHILQRQLVQEAQRQRQRQQEQHVLSFYTQHDYSPGMSFGSGSHSGISSGQLYSSNGSANGRELFTGPRGGTFYMTKGGNKRYV